MCNPAFEAPRAGHPLKEGLRPAMISAQTVQFPSQSGSSTKRGIKTQVLLHLMCVFLPRAGHPLKEGLRLSKHTFMCCNTPRAGHPLKEGLRQQFFHQ